MNFVTHRQFFETFQCLLFFASKLTTVANKTNNKLY